MIIIAAILIACTIINRASGDASWMPRWLPGRPLWYTSPLLAGYASLVHTWDVALAFGVAYLVWRLLAWGRWFDLGRLPDGYARVGVKLDPYERIISALSCGSDHIALFLRHLMIVPGLALVSFLMTDWIPVLIAFPFAMLIVGAYELAWRWRPRAPIMYAELMVGALWGLLILGV